MKTAPSKIRIIVTSSTVLASIVMFAGCTVGPDYKKPEVAIPHEFREQTGASNTASIADLPWWDTFQDKALQELISEALANNYDLKMAVSRIEQARALVDVTRSGGLPQIGYNATGGSDKAITVQEDSVGDVRYNRLGGSLNALWELDVWGRIRHTTEASMANLLAQQDVYHGVILTLVSDIATNYFQLLELDRELAIAQESSDTYKRMVNLFSDRLEAGKDSELPVHRGQAAYNSSIATIAFLKQQITLQENVISILLGGYPKAIKRGHILTEQVLPETPLGTTTDILQRRPDIMQAEQAMVAANAEIGVAVANFYPTFSLSALLGIEGVEVSDEFSKLHISNALGNITGPIFTGGRLQAIYRQRQAFWDEAVTQYKKTVLTAFKETSDALAAQKNLVNRRDGLQKQVEALRRAMDISLLRYDGGRSSYFEVLEAQQLLFPAEAELAQTQRDQLIAVVNLYKSLGGGWKPVVSGENSIPENVSLHQDSIQTEGK